MTWPPSLRDLFVAALLVLLVALPLYTTLTGNFFLLSVFTRIVILAIAAVSLNLIMGYGGMVSFGHAAFIAAVFVGLVDTVGRAFLPDLLRLVLSTSAASTAARALSSMLIYLLMAIVLVVRPAGLFPAPGR